ncbi:hypothetical protein A2Z67_05290 [Candidatus Woesebacteria bacterium RBG_13_36_22]|uniref:Uncharacterized protein n=1 Tax=Candidatus Woesebacteria bacterium RBG_13_36_22 TaxID=1802478 RepID=A0A1F7X2M0_9BACT|nr:MAG: hypothetical protein A2Z67_05290 [Candidatus Woesebacteria bacterium RBG_13_36_22]
MKKMKNKEILLLMKRIEGSKKIIVAERDKLRKIYSELSMFREDIVDSCDTGIQNIDKGLSWFQSGIEDLSQFLPDAE